MTPEQRTRYLELENEQLRHENATLRKRCLETSAHTRRIERAYDHALLLASWCAGGIPPSRRFAARHNMGQRHWQNACALLRMARVLDRNRHWVSTDLAVIETRLERARADAIASPDAFKARLVKHGKAQRHGAR